MTRRAAFLAVCFLFMAVTGVSAQLAIGEWTVYMSYSDATEVETYGDVTYCVADGNLYAFDSEDNSVTEYSKVNVLSDTQISHIKYSPDNRALLIVYENGNFDIMIDGGQVYNISDLKESTRFTSKTINDIFVSGEYAYLAGDFGVCIINMKKREISNTYKFEIPVLSNIVVDNVIYAATDQGIYKGDMKKNLLDFSNWTLWKSDVYSRLALMDGRIYATDMQVLYVLDTATDSFKELIRDKAYFLNVSGNRLIYGRDNKLNFYSSDGTMSKLDKETNFKDAEYNAQKDTYWAAAGWDSVSAFRMEGSQSVPVFTEVKPDGPRYSLFYFMKFFGSELLVGGGKLNYPDLLNPGTVMRFSDGKWSYLDEDIESKTGMYYYNVTSVARDPRDATHIFAGSSFGGLYEFKDDKFVNLYTYYADPDKQNSTLYTALPNEPDPRWYVRVDGLLYDRQNNLWMVNSSSSTIINVLKSDGKWLAFDHPAIAKAETVDKLIMDSRGYVWITLRRVTPGVFCFDYNGTLEDTSDDHTRFISSYVNQDGESLGELKTYDIAEDRNGSIWIGTEKGPLVINNASRIFSTSGTFTVTQIKVPRNDGTNLADYLLKDETINVILVDGANRKWLGTQNTGLYLVSEDGLEMIEHFDTSNSPLLSNTIESLTLDPETGELYVGTDKGLMCYRTDSSEPEETFNEDIYAFPNPVEPDYEGPVTVTGLVYDTDIKITDVSGRVVATGKSNGGTFSWDCRNTGGKKVPTGIYFVMASDPNGKSGIVTKITVIR